MLKLYRLISFKLDLTCVCYIPLLAKTFRLTLSLPLLFPTGVWHNTGKVYTTTSLCFGHSLFTLLEVQFNSVVPNFLYHVISSRPFYWPTQNPLENCQGLIGGSFVEPVFGCQHKALLKAVSFTSIPCAIKHIFQLFGVVPAVRRSGLEHFGLCLSETMASQT